jgi:hypothetical protein
MPFHQFIEVRTELTAVDSADHLIDVMRLALWDCDRRFSRDSSQFAHMACKFAAVPIGDGGGDKRGRPQNNAI